MPDFTGQDVNNWYQQYWGRPAESWEQDYWQQQGLSAGDVQRTLAEAPEAQGQGGGGGGGGGQTVADFERDYWAPDREEVLAAIHSGQWWGPEWQRPVDLPAPGGGQLGLPGSPVGGWGGGYGGGGAFNESALSQAWLGSGGRTPQDLARFLQQNPQLAQGVTITGSKGDKLRLPNGQIVDAVLASGEGGRGAQWLTEGGGGGGGGAYGGASYGQAPNPTPFKYDPFVAPGGFTFEDFQAPTPFKGPEWQAPTGVSDVNDPGYSARLAEGQRAIERAAAAKGTLLTGGTLKDISRYGQEYAANEYQNVYNRAFQNYQTDYGRQVNEYNQAAEAAYRDYVTSRQNAFENYQTNYQNALNAYQTNFETQFKPWEANYGQAYQSWLGNYNAANQGFQNQLAKENQRFQQLYNTAQLGLQASGQQANYGAGYAGALGNIYGNWGQSAGDLMTGQGNAQAAGQVGGANAWNQFTGNLANMASLYGLSDVYGGGGGGTRSRQPGPWSGGYQF